MTSGKAVINGVWSDTGGDGPVERRVWAILRRSGLLVCPLMLVVNLSRATTGSDWTVEALMDLLRTRQEMSVPFEEATYSSLLTEPIKAHGLLKFVPPEKLEKIITTPSHERYLVDGDRVTFESERKGIARTISLEEYPALRSFVEAFRASLSGDSVRLRQVYEVTLDGTSGNWTLLLRPRKLSGKSLVDYILLTGSEGRVKTIAIRSPDGDRSVMTLLRGAPR